MEGLMEKSFRVKVVGAVTGILNGQKGDCQNTAINCEIIRKLHSDSKKFHIKVNNLKNVPIYY